MKKIQLFTDGACSGNPGPGAWAAILRYGPTEKELVGGELDTTNNRMELTAVIRGLQALKEPCEVHITSDSTYVVHSIQKGWLNAWQKNGWRKADKKPVLNRDLWEELLPLLAAHTVHFHWIRGHTGHAENERCDALAVACYTAMIKNT